jgi:hypothetical protein
MILAGAVNLHSDVLGLAVAGAAIVLLLAAQLLELRGGKVAPRRIVGAVAAIACLVSLALIVDQFSTLR